MALVTATVFLRTNLKPDSVASGNLCEHWLRLQVTATGSCHKAVQMADIILSISVLCCRFRHDLLLHDHVRHLVIRTLCCNLPCPHAFETAIADDALRHPERSDDPFLCAVAG
jgi:hypothetical protein